MTTYLDDEFVRMFQNIDEQRFEYRGRTLTIRRSQHRAGFQIAELEVLEGSAIIGYITPYGRNERGAIAARLFGGPAPVVARTLDRALDEILSAYPAH